MTTIYTTHPIFPDHDLPDHPEHAGRIRTVWRRLEEDGLTARMMAHTPWAIDDNLILSVHSPAYLDLLRTLTDYQQTVHFDADTYATPNSLTIARLAAGGVVEAIDAVLSGKAANGLAAVRPPGHHAMPDYAMGFCLLGNIAIGARFAQRAHGLKRVLILDYDVHHGNGTEAMFYDDPSVHFISTHQYPLYPGTGALTDIGTGAGEGATLNIPIPGGCGDAHYQRLFQQVIAPSIRRFEPELILISAGFDAHWDDPLAMMRLTLGGFADLSKQLIDLAGELCGGKIVFVMEGGYNLSALSEGMANVARLLLGDAPTDTMGAPKAVRPLEDIDSLVTTLRTLHRLA